MLLDQVLQYAVEIADAPDKAYREGVTHRDLKPGNIMLTKSGTKLLDFGLAKLKQETTPANISLSKLPTANDAITAQGAIVGTLQWTHSACGDGKRRDVGGPPPGAGLKTVTAAVPAAAMSLAET